MVRSFYDPNLIKQMMPKQGLSSTPIFDVKQLMETQRKNAQTVSDLMQLGLQSVQQAWSCQAELMSKIVQENSSLASSLMAEGTPEQKVQRQADLLRQSYESTIKGAREVSDIITKSGEEAAEIINRRVSASLTEFKAAFDRDAADAAETLVKTAANSSKAAARKAKAKAA